MTIETDLSLSEDIKAFIRESEAGQESRFNTLALRLFARQYRLNKPYRTFCDGRNSTPENVQTWQQIPAAPASAFKHFPLSCAPIEDCTVARGGRVFYSSGTTSGETSRHYLDKTALDLYQFSLRQGYEKFVLPDRLPLPVYAMMPTTEEAPNSSLSFMLETLIQDYGGRFFWGENWENRLAEILRHSANPLVLFGTAFAWVHFLDAWENPLALPGGSRIVETGGFKGRSREVSRDELYRQFTQQFGVPETHCLAEYGMSEMASQFYDSSLFDAIHQNNRPPRKIAPYWLRTRVMNPVTGEEAQPSENGLLAHYDLANFNSVLAIQTEDYGHTIVDSEGFVLLGRAPGAILRGCSLLVEEMG